MDFRNKHFKLQAIMAFSQLFNQQHTQASTLQPKMLSQGNPTSQVTDSNNKLAIELENIDSLFKDATKGNLKSTLSENITLSSNLNIEILTSRPKKFNHFKKPSPFYINLMGRKLIFILKKVLCNNEKKYGVKIANFLNEKIEKNSFFSHKAITKSYSSISRTIESEDAKKERIKDHNKKSRISKEDKNIIIATYAELCNKENKKPTLEMVMTKLKRRYSRAQIGWVIRREEKSAKKQYGLFNIKDSHKNNSLQKKVDS